MAPILILLGFLFQSTAGKIATGGVVAMTRTSPIALYVSDGDSITAGAGLTNPNAQVYPAIAIAMLATPVNWLNFGTSTHTCVQRNTAASQPGGLDSWVVSGGTNVLSIDCGINDLQEGASPATAYSSLLTYVAARKAAGWNQIIVSTLTDCTCAASRANIVSFNSSVRSGAGANGYIVTDPGGDAIMGCAGCSLNTTYFQAGIHPTAAGHSIMGAAPYLISALNTAGLH